MTKHSRDHREWTNLELEQDPEGYLAAQQAFREDKAAEEQKRRDADDLKRYTQEFVRNGGNKRDAEASFRAHRNEQAATAAQRADQAAANRTRRHVVGRL